MQAADEKIEWESYLGFLLDHDLDSVFEAEPINRTLAENKSTNTPAVAIVRQNARPAPANGPASAPPPPVRPQSDITALKAESRQRAQAARTIEELYAEWEGFKALPLRNEGARQIVKAFGAPNPQLLVIGDVPEEAEDQSGEAFSARPGQLIRRAVTAAGLADKTLFTPCVPFRPAGGRPLSSEDIALNSAYLHALIRMSAPTAILLLGSGAVGMALNIEGPLGKLRGRKLNYTGEDSQSNLPAMISFAPGFLLQNPAAKGILWADLLNLVADLPQN